MKPIKKFNDYIKNYSESDLHQKLKKTSGSLSKQLLYYVLVLYFLIADKNIPAKVRMVFIAALGYFILPTDLVTDFLPVNGFTDDIAFLTYAISNATEYITPEILEKAKSAQTSFVGDNEIIVDDRDE